MRSLLRVPSERMQPGHGGHGVEQVCHELMERDRCSGIETVELNSNHKTRQLAVENFLYAEECMKLVCATSLVLFCSAL